MIVHVFTANRYHLVPSIVNGFLKYMDRDQYFLLVGDETLDKERYIKLFQKYNKTNYSIITSFGDLKKESRRFKRDFILLHGVPFGWMFYYISRGYKNVNWICWGFGARIDKSNWQAVLSIPKKKFIYRRFKKVGVLMHGDEVSLRRDFNVQNISLLPYFGTIDSFPYNESHLKETKGKVARKKVYLGNNSSWIHTYQPLIEKLSKFKQDIIIHCMLNYSFKEDKVSENLRLRGKQIYGDNFKMDTNLYSLEDYYKYMDNCDIYICDVKNQTGLGAIYTCLRLGKKVFLSGINYEWIKSLGCRIYHVDKIENMSSENFLEELSYEDKLHNYNKINSYLDLDSILKNWNNFLEKNGITNFAGTHS